MSDDEKQLVVQMMQNVMDRKPKKEKASSIRDWLNFGITAIIIPVILLCWLIISQKIDLMGTGIESRAKDTYLDKPTFNAAITGVNDRFDKQEQHLDFVDNRENSDKSVEDIKIQQLQDLTRAKYSVNVTTNRTYEP